MAISRADMLSYAQVWGGSKQYISRLNGGEIELRNIAASFRDMKCGAQ